jgi:hypothetical protein
LWRGFRRRQPWAMLATDDMRMVKHAYKARIRAMKSIEY